MNLVVDTDRELSTQDSHIIVRPNVNAIIAHNNDVRIVVERGACLKLLTQGSGIREVHLGQDAQLDWIDVTDERSSSIAYLDGAGASAKFRSLFVATNDESYDVQVSMIHKGSHTTSNMLTRAVLLGASQGKYRGLIKIHPDAKGCDAHQREDTLLLGSRAKMDAVPVLEISNNDVKCSHGVTLGQVDEEQLFYLASRGIPPEMATTMLVHGFFDQLLISMGAHGQKLKDEIFQKVSHA